MKTQVMQLVKYDMDYALNSKDELTTLIREKRILTWQDLIQFVKYLPYGRNENRSDFSLVITEGKGSCSSKHAMLKKVADLNGIPNIKLILGVYKMSNQNTPKIGDVLQENGLDFVPEAHCYLKVNDVEFDYTSADSQFQKIQKDILEEIEIQPEQVAEFKVQYHQRFVKKWLKLSNTNLDFKTLWQIREQCIKNLANHS